MEKTLVKCAWSNSSISFIQVLLHKIFKHERTRWILVLLFLLCEDQQLSGRKKRYVYVKKVKLKQLENKSFCKDMSVVKKHFTVNKLRILGGIWNFWYFDPFNFYLDLHAKKNEVSQHALAFDTQALMFVFIVNIILKYYNVLIINSPIIIFSRKFLLNIILLVNLCYL